VLPHCLWATSAIWAAHVRALADNFTIYASGTRDEQLSRMPARRVSSDRPCKCGSSWVNKMGRTENCPGSEVGCGAGG